MGALPGGINMITGRTEPLEPAQSYEDWLMELLIQHGTDIFDFDDGRKPYSKYTAALSIGHIEVQESKAQESVGLLGYKHRLTNKAQRYLNIMNKETDDYESSN
jgi:hypothetical protein